MATSRINVSEHFGNVSDIDVLISRVRGPVFQPGDAGYDSERAGFQTADQHRPEVIVGATGAADVCAAVAFAAANGKPIAVQSTGHGMAKAAEGGTLISTRRMTGVRVDAEARTACIDAGVRWEQVIHEAALFGLAPLSGSSPDVGAISYTLSGGVGLLGRHYGYAADHVRSIDVVTADARLRRVTPESDQDLFWALRGGRDNFGVVTSMEVDLVPVTQLYGGTLIFDTDLVKDVLPAYLSWTATVPDELSSSVGLISYPDVPGFPATLRGRYVASIRIAYDGNSTAGERLVEALRSLGPRLIDSLADMPYTNSGSICNEPNTPHAYYGDGLLLREFDASTVSTVLELTGPDAPVMSVVQINHLGGALARQPAVTSAIGHRNAKYLLRIVSPLDGSDTGAARTIQQRLCEALEPWTIGRSLGFMFGEHTDSNRLRIAYQVADYQRLTELKRVYDPGNLFRLNRNIPPADASIPISPGRRSAGMT